MSAPEVLLFTIDAGGGHRAAARALAAAAEETGAPFRFRVESFQQTLLPLDVLKRATGLSLEDAYNALLRQRWSALMVPLLRVMHAARESCSWLTSPSATVGSMPRAPSFTAPGSRRTCAVSCHQHGCFLLRHCGRSSGPGSRFTRG